MAGARFGRFELLQRIGAGGAGEVLLVSDGQTQLALKRLLPHLSDPASTASFDAEAALAARLHHRNVVRVLEHGQVQGTAYVVMEYVDGKSLHQLLGRCGRLSPAAAAFVVRELCHGLDYVHGVTGDDGRPLGLIHRDVSPANVLVSRDGQVKLCDFGIAKGAATATGLRTQPGFVKGKRGYLSPEQAAGQPLDARSDVYSAGVVLREALGDDVPAGLAPICSRALAPLRDERFADAGALAAALDLFLDGKDGQAELAASLRRWFPADLPVGFEPTRTLVPTRGRRLVAGALLALVLIAGVALLVYRRAPLPPPPPTITPPIAAPPPPPPTIAPASPPKPAPVAPARTPRQPKKPAAPAQRPPPAEPRRDYMPDPFKR